MIQVEHLTKRYGPRQAVSDVSFRVDKGEIVGFLGPNGAGKSTTLRMVTGFVAPSAGSVRVDGIDALERPLEARKRIGYMPEGVPLYPEMRVREYLQYRAELKGVARKRLAAAVDRSLEQAGVTDARDRIIGQLSKGYRQRVGLADALVADPPLLILDEPTAGLDPNQIRQVRDLVRSFAGDKTVFLSTHILPEVEATCGRVIIINKGRVVGEGPPDSLRTTGRGMQVVSLVARAASGAQRDGARAALTALLEKVDGVKRVVDVADVAAGDAVMRARAETDPKPEIVEAIFRAIADAGMALRELRTESASLEDVFANLTTEDRGAAADDQAAESASAAASAAGDDEEAGAPEPPADEKQPATEEASS